VCGGGGGGMEGDAGDEGGEEGGREGLVGKKGFFFFFGGRESTDVERCKLFPNLNLHSSLTFMPRNPMI